MSEQIEWEIVKEAGTPVYHLRLTYPWAHRLGVPTANVAIALDEDELRSLQDAIAAALWERT